MLPISFFVPDLPGVARIDLVGAEGVLDTTIYSVNSPAVTITSPAEGSTVVPVNGKVSVTWTGSDLDGDTLLYTVLYSSDGGQTFIGQSLEQEGRSFDVTLSEATEHMVKVIVTDGARSAEAIVTFLT